MLKFIVDRLKERSTWLGLTAFATALGVSLAPQQLEAIILAGTAIGGLVAAFTKDKPVA